MFEALPRVVFFCLIMLFLVVSPSVAGTDPAYQQLLTDAASLVNLRCSEGKPFELMAEFTARTDQPRSGHLTLRWSAKDLWSEDILAGDYFEHDVRKGDNLYIDRNAPFTPVFVRDIRELLSPLCADSSKWKIRKKAPRTFESVTAQCLEAKFSSPEDRRDICIDPASKDLLSITMPDRAPPQEDVFSSAEPFGNLRIPRHSQRFWKDQQTLDLKVLVLQEKSFEASAFTPRPGSIVRRQCENMKPPVLIHQVEPVFSEEARQKRVNGTVSLQVTVLPAGSVDSVQFMQRAGAGLDEAAESAVKRYKFKPAMCGSEPVAADIIIEVEFRLGLP
jgi:TonB family protein